MEIVKRLQARDPRVFQIAFLSALLFTGFFFLNFQIRPEQILLNFTACLLTQVLFIHGLGIPQAGYKSALITALGFSVLARADNLWILPLAAALGTAAKFLLWVGNKHVFNPGNLALALVLLLPGGWASPGQWGNTALFACWFLLMGFWVVQRAGTLSVSWAFLGFYTGLLLLRTLFLGFRPEVFWHQLQNGGLVMFTFFMISDPMTIPNHRRGRVLHAGLVALIAFTWQFGLYRFNGLYWALLAASLLVPLWDRIWPAEKPGWGKDGEKSGARRKELTAAAPDKAPRPVGKDAVVGAMLAIAHPGRTQGSPQQKNGGLRWNKES